MKAFLENIEIWLCMAGVAVIFLIPALLIGDPDLYWKATALTAVAVGMIHGMVFWLVRRRQRSVRRAFITHVRGMLMDRVNNQLMIILAGVGDEAGQKEVEDLKASVEDISDLIRSLNEESLTLWEKRYAKG